MKYYSVYEKWICWIFSTRANLIALQMAGNNWLTPFFSEIYVMISFWFVICIWIKSQWNQTQYTLFTLYFALIFSHTFLLILLYVRIKRKTQIRCENVFLPIFFDTISITRTTQFRGYWWNKYGFLVSW